MAIVQGLLVLRSRSTWRQQQRPTSVGITASGIAKSFARTIPAKLYPSLHPPTQPLLSNEECRNRFLQDDERNPPAVYSRLEDAAVSTLARGRDEEIERGGGMKSFSRTV